MRQPKSQKFTYNHKPIIRVAILSDTHAYLNESVLVAIKGSDLVIHAGDICNADILVQLREHVGELVAVKGNNDLTAVWPQEQHSILNELPDEALIDLPGGQVAVEHGHRLGGYPDHGALRHSHEGSRLVVYGHTHKIVCDQEHTPWVVNPGAAGLIRNHGGPTCLILEASEADWTLTMRRSDGVSRLLVA